MGVEQAMTWIVGTPTMFGYGFGISDVRVTAGNGSGTDCLQKIHPIGRWIAAGFAGDVRIGFAMVDELQALLFSEDEHLACDPLLVAQEWPHDARQVFARFPPDARGNGCHLMLISTHPEEHTGNPLWARSYVHILRSPDFQAEMVPVHTLGSIGCGDKYPPCRAAVETFSSDFKRRNLLMQGEVGMQGGMATMLGFDLTQLLLRTQPGGISSHLQYCWVYRGEIIIKTNDYTQKGRWSIFEGGSGINRNRSARDTSASRQGALENGATAFGMPRLATTWEDLVQILDAMGATAEGCVA
jgi:hypothetical protein